METPFAALQLPAWRQIDNHLAMAPSRLECQVDSELSCQMWDTQTACRLEDSCRVHAYDAYAQTRMEVSRRWQAWATGIAAAHRVSLPEKRPNACNPTAHQRGYGRSSTSSADEALRRGLASMYP